MAVIPMPISNPNNKKIMTKNNPDIYLSSALPTLKLLKNGMRWIGSGVVSRNIFMVIQ